MNSKWLVMGIFGVWILLIMTAFMKYSLTYDPFFGNTRNVINRHQARGDIKDRKGETLAYGSGANRKYTIGPAGGATIGVARPEIGVEGFIEKEFGERLVSSKKSKMSYFLNQNEEGYPLKTTIDKGMQLAAYKAMNGYKGAVVIIKMNGEGLVSVSTPSYDPNKMSSKYYEELRNSSDKLLFNRALDGKYEPGSVWKTIVAISLLEKKSEGKPVLCNGQLIVGNKTIHCMHSHGSVKNIEDAFAQSCNVWFMKNAIAELDSDTLKKISNHFTSRKIKKELSQADIAMTAIGQGEVQASPMELAQLAAAIGNKGFKPEPRFVKENISTSKVFDEKTAAKLTEMMTQVVKRGTGKGLSTFLKSGYLIAAKTGTAERDTPNGKINTAVLIGFAGHKKDKPEIAFSVVIEETTGLSGTVCVPVMKEILGSYFSPINGK